MSSIDPEECCHKLMKISLPAGQEPELPSMIIECCSQERTYSKFYGLIGERFAKINRLWTDLFEQSFAKYYDTIHRYETNRLRNIARFFGHLISSDAIGWHVLSVVHLNEEETTSSSRIFIKILFQDLAEAIGMPKLQARLKDDVLRSSFEGIFPRDNPRNTRFSINYFTSIGMGAVTEEMREYLQNMPKPALPAPAAADGDSNSDSGSSVSSYSSYTRSSYSRSRSLSRDRAPIRRRSLSRTPPRIARDGERSRGRSLTRSITRSLSRSVSLPRRDGRRASRSATPPRRRQRDDGYSRSPPPRRATTRAEPSPPPPRHRQQGDRGSRSSSQEAPRRSRRRNSSSLSSMPRRRRDDSLSRSPPPASRRNARRNTSSPSVGPATGRRGRDDKPPPRRARRDDSYDRSPEPRRVASMERGRGRDRARGRDSMSVSPPAKRRRDYSDSRSPPPKRGRRYS